MATEKQIAANRENALKSTGPNTAKGKSKSRLNAIRDGLTGQITTLSPADRLVFEKLKTDLAASFNPQTPMETKLANSVAWDTWRLDHLRAIEMNVYSLAQEESLVEREDRPEAAGENASTDPDDSDDPDDLDTAFSDARTFRAEAKRFELMSLYEQRMNRSIHRNITLLRELQAERKRQREEDKKDEIAIARLHELNEMPIQASRYPSKNGFIFSDEEIAVGMVHQRYVDIAKSVITKTYRGDVTGGLDHGAGDAFLTKLNDRRLRTPEEKREHCQTPPEVLAIDRLNNPEAFGILLPNRQ
jgi:hypothetical protein